MKTLFAFGLAGGLALLFAAPAGAQFGARSGALGGSFASRGISRPLGGITPAFPVGRGAAAVRPGSRRAVSAYPYGYSVYVPSYADSYYAGYYDLAVGYGTPYTVEPYAPPPQPQPVIINQYFGVQSPLPNAEATTGTTSSAETAPGDLIGAPQNYYLIAYKNHAVYAALTYWVEDKTLHYVTTQNTHNQASLDLVDLDLTKQLNQSRGVAFSLSSR